MAVSLRGRGGGKGLAIKKNNFFGTYFLFLKKAPRGRGCLNGIEIDFFAASRNVKVNHRFFFLFQKFNLTVRPLATRLLKI